MDYLVRLGRFEGPYTKLLSLIEERKLSITEIDLAHLADDYILYTKSIEEKDHLDISLFIVVASTLMLMKVRSLLPKIDYTKTEEKQITDLTQKLLLLSYLENKTKSIAEMFAKKKFFTYSKVRIKKKEFTIPKNVSQRQLEAMGQELCGMLKKESYIKNVGIIRKISLEDTMAIIRSHGPGKHSLRSISRGISDEKGLMLSFLSVLELVRQGEFEASQDEPSDILIERILL